MDGANPWTPGKRRIGAGIAAALAIGALVAAWWCRPMQAPVVGEDRDLIYFIMVDRYADGLPDAPDDVDRSDPQAWHGGDLRGVLEHVDDLAALGVGAVWLSPVTEARTAPHGPWGAYHGYWVEDLRTVEPRFGTRADLVHLAEALHARGIRLYLDMVYNHVAPDGTLLREHPDWFHGRGDVTDWADTDQVVNNDVHGLPDLAQERDDVYTYLRDASLGWLDDVHPDGFRVDAVRHLAPGFLARLGRELREHAAQLPERPGADFQLLGEVFDGSADRVADRAIADDLDAVFDFPYAFAIRDAMCGPAPVAKIAALTRVDYGRARPVTLVDNHDLPRIAECGDDRAAVALGLLFTSRGTPSMPWGTEIGALGAEAPANRADMVFEATEVPLGATVRELIALRRSWEALRAPDSRVVGLDPGRALVARLGARDTVVVAIDGSGRRDTEIPRWTRLDGAPDEVRAVVGAGPLLRHPGAGERALRLARYARPVKVAEPSLVALTVALTDLPPVPDGDRVVLVGAGDALGRWDASAGVPLDPDGAFHLQVSDGEVLAFKPAIVRPDGVTWEPHPDRFLLVTSDRWTGSTPCGAWCAPVVDGAAAAAIAWGEARLIAAAAAGDRIKLAAEIGRGADLNAEGPDGRTALQVAVDRGDDRAVETLLRAGASAPDLLVRAARVKSDRTLALVLALGLPVDVPGPDGVTPLMAAVDANNPGAVRRLRALGADPRRTDADGRSAIDRASTEAMREVLGGG